MKKMVCEICGSQAIKKEHGCFVCKECGTEYSLEDAKKLLVSVDDPLDTKSQDNANTDVSGKEKLLYALNLWTLTLSKIPDVKFWFSKPCRVDTNEFWEVILEDFLINTQNYNLDHLKYVSCHIEQGSFTEIVSLS